MSEPALDYVLLYHESQVRPGCWISVVDHAQADAGAAEVSKYLLFFQVAALCGVHCLNTLLQGPYFSEVELSQVRPPRSTNTESF